MSENDHTSKNLFLAFFLNLGLAIIEIVGAILSNSVALASDAIHDFGDAIALGIAWVLEKISHKKPDQKYSYGYRRFSLLGALITGLILLSGGAFVILNSIPRLLNPEKVDPQTMLIIAVLSFIINGIAIKKLNHSHSHNVEMVKLHLLEDFLGSILIIFLSIILLFTDFYILDPILSLIIVLYILINTIIKIKRTVVIFLQKIPSQIDLIKIEKAIMALSEVKSLHDKHAWSLDGDEHVLSLHVVIKKPQNIEDFQRIQKEIKSLIPIKNTTVQIEIDSIDC